MNPTKGKRLTLIFPNIQKLCSLDETINDKKLEPFVNVPVKDWKFLYIGKDKVTAPKIFYQIFQFAILALDFLLDTGFFF
jgi:hypothetical protein